MLKLKSFDFFLLLLFTLISGVAAFYAYNLTSGLKSSSNVQIGEVTDVFESVYQKGNGDFFYNQTNKNSPVFEGDQITTGLGSSAEVLFPSQSTLTINELSHVILSVQNQTNTFEIQSGQVTAKVLDQELIIVDGENEITPVEGEASFLVNKSSSGNEIKVLKGKIQLSDGQKNIQVKPSDGFKNLKPLKRSLLSKEKKNSADKALIETKQEIQLLAPRKAEDLLLIDKKSIFLWEEVPQSSEYKIKIFQNKMLVQSYQSKKNNINVTLPREGNYEWLVEAYKEDVKIAASNKISFQAKWGALIKLINPKKEEKFYYKAPLKIMPITFSWEAPSHLATHLILEKKNEGPLPVQALKSSPSLQPSPRTQASPTSQLSKSSLVEEKNKTSIRWEKIVDQSLANGVFVYKMDLGPGFYQWKISPKVSQNSTDEIGLFEIIKTAWPALEPPLIEDISTLFTKELKKTGAEVSWTQVTNAQSYEVEYLGKIIKTDRNSISFPVSKPFKASYKVRALNPDLIPGNWSPSKNIEIKTKIAAKPTPSVTPKPSPTPTPTPTPIPTPKPKRVQGIFNPKIEVPEIVYPEHSMTFVSRSSSLKVQIELKTETCNFYEIELDADDKFMIPTILKIKSSKISITLKKGPYYIRARCWFGEQMGKWTKINTFYID